MLEAKGRAAVGRLERDIALLETDLEELRRRDEEIGQLLRTEDNVRLTQVTGQKREESPMSKLKIRKKIKASVLGN